MISIPNLQRVYIKVNHLISYITKPPISVNEVYVVIVM